MAREPEGATGLKIGALVLTVSLCGPIAWGQDAAAPPAMPAPFSRDCQVGTARIVSELPLPHVAAALQKRKAVKILAIGAAATAGQRGRRGGHTKQIQEILENAIKGIDVVMINRGVSGELAADAAGRIKTAVALYEPDLVLWQVGTNDALAFVPIDELRRTITDTVRWLKEHNVDVVLAGLQFVSQMEQDDHYRAVRELIRKVGADENVVVVRRSEAMRLLAHSEQGGGGLFPEEFAQTEAGYACLAEYFARAITLGAFGRGLRPQPGQPQTSQPPQPPRDQQ
jgi:lysophospholipase L1-like esterase